jgi:hypothetical protein
MVMKRLGKRSYRLILDMRQGLYVAILSGFFIISGCQSTGPKKPTPDFKPQSVIDIVHIQPFQLKQSFKYDWRRDRPDVRFGLLVVFKVAPDLVMPKNALEPVLYAGNQTVQRLNHGHESGFVIGIIPEQIDLSKEPVWFGTPALPERIDAEMIAKERAKAERAGILPLKSINIQSRARDMIVVSDLTTLLREQAANLLLEFSPQEKKLADSWRLPVTSQ